MKKLIIKLMVILLAFSSFGCQKVEAPEESKPKLLMEEISYDQNGRETNKRAYTYDDRGNFTSIGDSRDVMNYEYEEDRVIRASQGQRVSTYAYDENKNLIEVIKKSDGEAIGSIKYDYDEFNNLIKMITESEGEVFEAIYTYNKDNLVVESISSRDNKEFKTKFEYDKDGNCIKETQYIDRVIEMEITSVYESNLLITQKHDNLAVQNFIEIKYEYNEDKQVSQELVSYDGDSFFKSKEYIYGTLAK